VKDGENRRIPFDPQGRLTPILKRREARSRAGLSLPPLATILSVAGAAQQRDQQAAKSPFVGSWSADLSQSRLDPKMPIKGADVTISVTGNVITLANSVVMPSGETIQERETLRADGTETAATNPPYDGSGACGELGRLTRSCTHH
jgi:hypothetical protein